MNRRILALASILLVAVLVIGCGPATERQGQPDQPQQPGQQVSPDDVVPQQPQQPVPPPVSPDDVRPPVSAADDDLLGDPSSPSEPVDPSILPAENIVPSAPTG